MGLALLGAAELWSGRLEEAAAHLERAVEAAAGAGRAFVEVDATAHLALLEAVRGRLARAGELARTALERAGRGGWAAGTPVACAELATAAVAYHRDELATASAALERATAAAGDDRLVLLAAAVLAAWLAADGDPAERGAALARLDAAVRATGGRPPRLLAAAARTARSRLLAVAGDDPAAVAALGGGDGLLDPMETVALARMRLARGEPVGAVATLAPLLAGLGAGAPEPATAIYASLIDAVANQQLADRDAAARSLRRALELAGPEGYRRAFVEGGTPVRVLLVDHLHRDPAHRALAGGLLERLRDSAAPSPPVPAMAAELVEPLSEREQVVLRYLPSSLSAGEIADELYVSLNTVKTHIKSIYRKLDTNRRWDAVRRARQLQLL
jgi:LuxR family maltose regulon positive regulatory protein